jgi:uncharacterized protein VirK/YbjX
MKNTIYHITLQVAIISGWGQKRSGDTVTNLTKNAYRGRCVLLMYECNCIFAREIRCILAGFSSLEAICLTILRSKWKAVVAFEIFDELPMEFIAIDLCFYGRVEN